MSFTIQVCAVVERETGEHITPGTRLEDLGLDSLEYANLLLEVSKSTGKEIPLERWGELHYVSDIARELV